MKILKQNVFLIWDEFKNFQTMYLDSVSGTFHASTDIFRLSESSLIPDYYFIVFLYCIVLFFLIIDRHRFFFKFVFILLFPFIVPTNKISK